MNSKIMMTAPLLKKDDGMGKWKNKNYIMAACEIGATAQLVDELIEACQATVDLGTAWAYKELNWVEKLGYANQLARQVIAKAKEKA